MFQNVFSFSFVRFRSKGIDIGHFSGFVSSQRITKHTVLFLLSFPSMFKFLSLQRRNEPRLDIEYKVNDTVSKVTKIDGQDVDKKGIIQMSLTLYPRAEGNLIRKIRKILNQGTWNLTGVFFPKIKENEPKIKLGIINT